MSNTTKTFCFECYHSEGIKRKCMLCWRYYHLKCVKTEASRKQDLEKWAYRKNPAFKGAKPEGTSPNVSLQEVPKVEPIESHCCYPCTLREKGLARQTPALSKDELNYLLRFVKKRLSGWTQVDSCNIDFIGRKVRRNEYLIPEELLIDLLDLLYRVATEFGRKYLNGVSSAVRYLTNSSVFILHLFQRKAFK